MTITDVASGISGSIGWGVDKVIFWKNWSSFSQTLLLITLILLVIGYMWLKSEMTRKTKRF